MPPSSQPSGTPSSASKKQQSISSFFTKVPSQKVILTNKAKEAQDDNLFLSDQEDEGVTKGRTSGSKRKSGDVDISIETGNEVEPNLPERKRQRSDDGTLHPIAANGGKKNRISERASKFIYSSSPKRDAENQTDEDDALTPQDKERLHQRFVKKLGRPDSIAEIKRRNKLIEEEPNEADENEEDGSEEEATKKTRKGASVKKGGNKLTPMEKQVLEIKAKHSDTLLVVEVGYKFRFFGEDARVAAKELGIVCIPGKMRYDEHVSEAHLNRFASASIPVHRLHVHVKRLVNAGHKVGVVRQLETAALKAAGDNRSGPFVRKLTNLYTKGTYVDDMEGLGAPAESEKSSVPATGYILCLTETKSKGWGTDEKVTVGIIAVQPATGDVIYDEFEDGFMRSEIETRLLHIAPCEFLIVGELSKASEKLVQHLSASKTNVFGDRARVERVERLKTAAAASSSHVSNFYAKKLSPSTSQEDERANTLLDKVLKLPENATICLSALIKHMEDYGLEHVFDLTKYFQSFSARSHMLLNGTTLSSLEIYQNQTDHSESGSLFWSLNRTKTRFGRRLLRKWVGRPLLDRSKLEERVSAVQELKDGQQSAIIEKIKGLLGRVRTDLEKSLIRIYYGKCSRSELLGVLQTLQRIANEFASIKVASDVGFASSILNEAVAALPGISDDIVHFLDKINTQAAQDDDKYAFFRENEETDTIAEHKLGIASVEHELNEHLPVAADKIKKRRVEYVTVAGIEYLIEVENTQLKHVPASWVKISGTKKVSRFHTPEVIQLVRERDQHKESLAAACDAAFTTFLAEIAQRYTALRDAVQALAVLDALLSLAAVAEQPGYVRPEYQEEPGIHIEGGRHPMVEQLLADAYVANDTALSGSGTRALLVTGPNMGGKSSYVRQVALLAVMAQIGSWVPASSMRLGLLDAVFTRMGAFDNVMAGESTFMVELSETSDVLKQATPRSLVILDELGRGTSTHDGVAIAHAVLDHLVRSTRCLCLFITHYQQLAALARAFDADQLRNVHMRFQESGAGGRDITFLYEVADGTAHRSYGLNVARLANVPQAVLDVAAVKSSEMEDQARAKRLRALAKSLEAGLGGGGGAPIDEWLAAADEL